MDGTQQRQPTEDEQQQERPAPDGFLSWPDYWKSQGMPWRTEPEIGEERQRYLAGRRVVQPAIEKGIYPFREKCGRVRLTRADIEWLLVTLESGGLRGPVSWSDQSQWQREGLDLRGADLRGVDLSGEFLAGMPLTRLRAGLSLLEWQEATPEQRAWASVQLQGANLTEAHLELARLRAARCEGATLRRIHLEGASLEWIHFEGADMRRAHLERADLFEAHLEGAQAPSDELKQLRLVLPGFPESLAPVDMRSAFFDPESTMRDATIGNKQGGWITVADVRWNGVNVATQDWEHVNQLGDERRARQGRDARGEKKTRQRRQREFERAVRAYRQLAGVCREQGLRSVGNRLAYRAEILDRHVFRLRRQRLKWSGSLLLDVTSGYGYKPLRSLFTYFVVVVGFAVTYFFVAPHVGVSLPPLAALVFSITSFHGRGFMPGENVPLTNPLTVLAASEAIIGLLIEITFIATFTQRFFAR